MLLLVLQARQTMSRPDSVMTTRACQTSFLRSVSDHSRFRGDRFFTDMKNSLIQRLLLCGLALGLTSSLSAETYSGIVRLRGEVQNEAKPGSISFNLRGQLTGKKSRDKANVTGGGLFRSTTDTIVDTTFEGRLKTYLKLTSRPGSPGGLVRSNRKVVVRVSRNFVVFPGGRIKLDRPIDGNIAERQRISGAGKITLRD